MVKKKATSAASAASRTRPPQTQRKAAARALPTRESRASEGVVADGRQSLQPQKRKHRLEGYDSRLVTFCMESARELSMQPGVEHLHQVFRKNRAFRTEMRVLLANLKDAGKNRIKIAAYVALFAARIFAAGEDNGYYTAHCERNHAAHDARKAADKLFEEAMAPHTKGGAR